MNGSYDIVVGNARLRYKLTVRRNITILRGDSATGKTTLIDMVGSYQRDGAGSGVTLACKKKCVVITDANWELTLDTVHDSIVFIDECKFITTKDFAVRIKNSDNYFVIATRHNLPNIPYSFNEIYGIRNKSGNRYQGTKRLYSEFYPLYDTRVDYNQRPAVVVTEDFGAGFEFFENYFRRFDIPCISARGKSNIYDTVRKFPDSAVLVIADGAAFGPEMDSVFRLYKKGGLILCLPESFEWVILKSGVIADKWLKEMLDDPSDYIDGVEFLSWERFFTQTLIDITKDTYLRYSKSSLNGNYLRDNITDKIIAVLPEIR